MARKVFETALSPKCCKSGLKPFRMFKELKQGVCNLFQQRARFDYLKYSAHNTLIMILYTFLFHFCSVADPGFNLRLYLSCERSELSLMGVWGLALPKFLNVIH